MDNINNKITNICIEDEQDKQDDNDEDNDEDDEEDYKINNNKNFIIKIL